MNKPHNPLEGGKKPELVIPTHDSVEDQISIVVVHKDRPEYLNICLQSIAVTSFNNNYEIIVVDNGSDEESQSFLEDIKNENVKEIIERHKILNDRDLTDMSEGYREAKQRKAIEKANNQMEKQREKEIRKTMKEREKAEEKAAKQMEKQMRKTMKEREKAEEKAAKQMKKQQEKTTRKNNKKK